MNPEVTDAINQLKEMTNIWELHPCLTCENKCEISEPLAELIRCFIEVFNCQEETLRCKTAIGKDYLCRMTTLGIFAAFNAWADMNATQFDDFAELFTKLVLGLLKTIKQKQPTKLESIFASVLKEYDGQVDWAKVLENVKEKKK